jgi:polyhydroxybutyrate depolymerase
VVRRKIASRLIAAALLTSCSTPVDPSGALPTTTASVAPTPSIGQERTITVGSLERQYLVYVPTSLDRSKPSPLVIYLHGSGQTMGAAERTTELSVQAEQQRFVVIYPQGLGGALTSVQATWNYGCCSAAFDQKVDDLGFMRQIIQKTTADLPIDPDRIYLAGFSAGATMAYRVACEAPQLLAAVGAISGGLANSTCSPPADLSILEIHGTKDELSPYGGCAPTTTRCGNPILTLPAVEPMMARFRELLGCPTPTIVPDGPVTRTTASPCRGGTEVTLITAEGGVHTSPLGSATSGTMASADVPAVLKFLFAHRRSQGR